MGTLIELADTSNLSDMVESVAELFGEDGAVRDPFMDTGWPGREGARYYADAIGDPNSLCLLAYAVVGTVIGHLVGRLPPISPLRPAAGVAVLESMRVDPVHRRSGVGRGLLDRFRAWAREHGCNELSVTAFSGNTVAIDFYRTLGFRPFELNLRASL